MLKVSKSKKKWFEKNIIEFCAKVFYKEGNCSEFLMYYNKYGQIGGLVDYHFRNDTRPTTKATSRKLSKMKIWEAYFYLRHLVLNNEKGKRKDKKVVKFISEVRMSDAL